MAKLKELYDELQARQASLDQAYDGGSRHAIASAREARDNMRHELVGKLLRPENAQMLMALAGELDLGPLSAGMELTHSDGPPPKPRGACNLVSMIKLKPGC